MANKIYQTVLTTSSFEIIEKYGSFEKAPKSKYKKYRKLIELIKRKKVILSQLFPDSNDAETKKYFFMVFDEKIESKLTDILADKELFESYYIKPSEDIPL